MMRLLLIVLITFTNVHSLINIENARGINARNLESTVVALIEEFGKKIIEHGFDPYFVERTKYETTILPNFLGIHLSVEDFLFTGASNIVINELKFSVKKHALFVEVSLPQIFFSFEEFLAAVIVYGRYYKALSHGSISLNEVRLSAKVTFVADSDLVFVENVIAKVGVASISSNIETNMLGVAIGPLVNIFMNQDVLKIIKNNSAAINAVLSAFLKNALNQTMEIM